MIPGPARVARQDDVEAVLEGAVGGGDALPGFAAHDDGVLGGLLVVVLGRRGGTFGDAGEEGEVGFQGRPGEGAAEADAEGGGGGDDEGEGG